MAQFTKGMVTEGQYKSIPVVLYIVLLLGTLVIGVAFYVFVLPKIQQPVKIPEPRVDIFTLRSEKPASVQRIPALPESTIVRIAHQTTNSHLAWGLANMGRVTDPGSLFARYGITAQFLRLEKADDRIAALRAMAVRFNRSAESLPGNPSVSGDDSGVHFFTIGGDESSWVISRANRMLKEVNPAFAAEIVGLSGLSAGEDTFLGLAEWKTEPRKAVGSVVSAVPRESAWNVLLFWCAENDIPVNHDQNYYDPAALNIVETGSPAEAAESYINNEKVERIFLRDGKNHWGRRVEKGGKAFVAIRGVATRGPFDQRIASARGGLVRVASTRQYPNHTPQLIVGLKQWNFNHQDVVVRMLASIFTASQQIEKSDRDTKAQHLVPKSEEDERWQAALYFSELFETEKPNVVYDRYDVEQVEDADGLPIEVGGVRTGNLQRNLLFFGLGRSGPDRGRAVYDRFAQLFSQYEPDLIEPLPEWEDVFNPFYLQKVLDRFPDLAMADPSLPTFRLAREDEPQELTYPVSFEKRSAVLTPSGEMILYQVLARIILAGDARFEIHGYTDSSGSANSNLELSRRRCETILNWLKDKLGASFPHNIAVFPHGESDLVVQDRIDGEYVPDLTARNRRVVLKIIPNKRSTESGGKDE
ncbi:MAG: OmpA family protein [Gammaproteobacteria bacterium]